MTEKTLEIQIPLLIPGLTNQKDGCLGRLEKALQNMKGILKAHIECEKEPPVLCLHYDPDEITIENVRQLAQRAGATIADRYHHEVITVAGMDCSDCVLVLEHGLERMRGVLAVNVSYTAETALVEYDYSQTNRATIVRRIHSLGYQVPSNGMGQLLTENRELTFSLAAGLLLLVAWTGERFLGFPHNASLTLYTMALFFGGWDVAQHAWHALRERRFDTDLLMVMAALGAIVLRDFADAALLLFLFSMGHALEERALDRARKAIRTLANLAPKTAWVQRDGREIEISVDEVQLGESVIVRPGVRLPVDGQVIAGASAIDQSPVTGESIPVEKAPGDPVFASSVNGLGALEVKATRLAKDSTLARVIQMVEAAQAQKSPTQQTTERFMRWFVPVVLVADALFILVPPLFGVPLATAFLRAMTLLVGASPCALALGTPSAILSGVARAARSGVLLKGGAHLENLGRLRAVAFDKTGTVTQGKPALTDVITLNSISQEEVLALAAALENRSAHPLAQAVVQAARQQGLSIPEVDAAIALTGRGIQARLDGSPAWIGNETLFKEIGLAVPVEVEQALRSLEDQGKTAMLVAREHELAGIVAVADLPRPETKEAITGLRRMGIRQTVLLSGDNPRVAAAIAAQLGLDSYRANLLPEQKLEAVRQMMQEWEAVAMVGDGVNDAPALAHATVGIAMGGARTDVALETADVALMSDDLSKLPFAIGLGRASRSIILQNLAIALGVIAVLMVTSILGWMAIGPAVVLHEGSTLLVALNSLRLLGYK